MNLEPEVHDLFDKLQAAVELIGKTNGVSAASYVSLSNEHHMTFQERWDWLRKTRSDKNQQFVEIYERLFSEIESLISRLSSLCWRAQPGLPRIAFRGSSDDVLNLALDLIRATIDWHETEDGHWRNFHSAATREQLITNRQQLEAADAEYPLSKAEGREILLKLREARGGMLLTLDQLPPGGSMQNTGRETKAPNTGERRKTRITASTAGSKKKLSELPVEKLTNYLEVARMRLRWNESKKPAGDKLRYWLEDNGYRQGVEDWSKLREKDRQRAHRHGFSVAQTSQWVSAIEREISRRKKAGILPPDDVVCD